MSRKASSTTPIELPTHHHQILPQGNLQSTTVKPGPLHVFFSMFFSFTQNHKDMEAKRGGHFFGGLNSQHIRLDSNCGPWGISCCRLAMEVSKADLPWPGRKSLGLSINACLWSLVAVLTMCFVRQVFDGGLPKGAWSDLHMQMPSLKYGDHSQWYIYIIYAYHLFDRFCWPNFVSIALIDACQCLRAINFTSSVFFWLCHCVTPGWVSR